MNAPRGYAACMAPYNQADDIEALCRCVGQLFRLAVAGKSGGQMSRAAAAAGLSVPQAAQFMDGSLVLPARQSVAFANAVLEQSREQQARYLQVIRTPHSGSGNQLRAGTNLTQAAADAAAAAEERDAEPAARRLRRAQ